jgi:hypothetical protein
MKPVVVMVAASITSWLFASAFLDVRTRVEVLLGMIGPLALASGSWILMLRTHQQRPSVMTSVMITAFAFKLVFFGAYVAVMLAVVSLRPMPFMASFIGYFIGLLWIEALYLQRLFR